MKRKILLIVFCLPILAGFVSDKNNSLPTDTPVALVKKIIPDVSYKKAGQSDWDVAKTGQPLNDGDEVITKPKSLALILFSDGSGLLRVRENSILHIYGKRENNKLNKNTLIDKGVVGFEVNKQEDDEFKFTTPTAVASIRGTKGYTEVTGDNSGGNTNFYLEEGIMDITCGTQTSNRLTAGNVAQVDKNCTVKIYPATPENLKLYQMTKMSNIKKVKIKTNHGDVEIDYYSSENK
jgi:hypothetical protein